MKALSSREWLAALAEASAVEIEIQESLTAAPSHPARWTVPLVTACDRIRSELGYVEPVGRAEGVRLTVSAAAA